MIRRAAVMGLPALLLFATAALAQGAQGSLPTGSDVGNLGWITKPDGSTQRQGSALPFAIQFGVFASRGRIVQQGWVYGGYPYWSRSSVEITKHMTSVGVAMTGLMDQPFSPELKGVFGGTLTAGFDYISGETNLASDTRRDAEFRLQLGLCPEAGVSASLGEDAFVRPFLGLGPAVAFSLRSSLFQFDWGLGIRLGFEAGMNAWPVSVTLGHQRLNHQDYAMKGTHDGMTFIAITPRGKHH